NQLQQIQTLTSQLSEFRHYEELFGNPAQVLLPTVQPLVDDLGKTELGQALTGLQTSVSAAQAMLYDGHGLFQNIGTSFTTPGGQRIPLSQTPYRPLAAVQKRTDNSLTVQSDRAPRRVALKEEIATSTEELKTASTAAEVQKLTGVLIGLASALNNS